MPLLGVTLTATGVARLEARPPQLAIGDVAAVDGGRDLEPGRPVRLLDTRGETRAIGVADPENELLREDETLLNHPLAQQVLSRGYTPDQLLPVTHRVILGKRPHDQCRPQ